MQVVWTPEALQDGLDIWEYIATENPRAVVNMDELFSALPPHRLTSKIRAD